MKTTKCERPINYKQLEQILDKMIEHCQTAKAECQKDKPSIVVLCDNAIEEIENLLRESESCIYTFNR